MGMFDSFLVPLGNREVEAQTKRFDCVLKTYRVGDLVSGAAPGLRVYFDQRRIDEDGRFVYRETESPTEDWTLFFVLANGVLVDTDAVAGTLGEELILQRIRTLNEIWQDSARLLERLTTFIAEKQKRIDRMNSSINAVRHVIRDTRRLRQGDDLSGPFSLIHESSRRLKQGDDPLDVIESVLGEDHRFFYSDPEVPTDRLADYRL
ncbi:hypothetical protein [Halochromatium roseum]|uniref:hypothetical protein n=1 Tax=Halochromatium roseum TaxID=391920 RepID=UPI001913B56E|nr:hypothetical protein [Halochromatium roseum]